MAVVVPTSPGAPSRQRSAAGRGDAPLPVLKERNSNSTSNVLTFRIPSLPAHTERLLELAIGRLEFTCTVTVEFKPDFPGLGPVPVDYAKAAALRLYASDRVRARACDYRFQTEVTESGSVAMRFKAVSDTLYLAVFTAISLKDVTITCRLGSETVTEYEDWYSLWQISEQYVCTPENYATVVHWFRQHRTALILKTRELKHPDTGENPIHRLMGACGDPKLLELYVKNCARFTSPNLEDFKGEVPLVKLLKRPDVYDPKGPLYYRCMALCDLLVRQCAVSLDRQDHEEENTPLHHACRHHRWGSAVLPMLLECGAGMFVAVKNKAGRTPLMEAQHPEAQLLPVEVVEVERLLSQPVPSLAQRTLLPQDRLTDAPFVGTGGADGSLGVAPSALSVDDKSGMPVREDDASSSAPPESLASPLSPARIEDRPADAAAATTADATASKKAAALPPLTGDDTDDLRAHIIARRKPPRLNEAKLKAEFRRLDVNGNGWLSTAELKQVYREYEHYGVVQSDAELDMLVEALGIAWDGRVTFDEYILVVMKMTRR